MPPKVAGSDRCTCSRVAGRGGQAWEFHHHRSRQGYRTYEHQPRRRRVRLVTEEYEYEFPCNYENIQVDRCYYRGSESMDWK